MEGGSRGRKGNREGDEGVSKGLVRAVVQGGGRRAVSGQEAITN